MSDLGQLDSEEVVTYTHARPREVIFNFLAGELHVRYEVGYLEDGQFVSMEQRSGVLPADQTRGTWQSVLQLVRQDVMGIGRGRA